MNGRLALTAMMLLAAACGRGPDSPTQAEAEKPVRSISSEPTDAQAATPGHSNQRVALASGEVLEVADGVAVLRGPDGAKLAENARVIRRPDPGGACLADGFRAAEAASEGFVLRNQLCSGWFFIEEVMTFAPSGDGYVLVRFSATYLDRRTAEPDGAPRVLTESELGHRRFQDLDPDDLYSQFD
ncbi:hypothetical protein H0E84_19595 [Luteimonas sp. SJ-92]|uniref:Lipoprotein n=1 Tax=Luteimonas salinisoli TaxID=2752307 RepID=A0A853JIQ6_9GAMM|nr:hypothetical protein [Luteimonas salinisoli]NZA28582.1 hypothetical protein [Luteimonas salinisoli]